MPIALLRDRTLGKDPPGTSPGRPDQQVDPLSQKSDLFGIPEALRMVRQHLDMDVAYVAEFIGQKQVFRFVDTRDAAMPIRSGDVLARDGDFCQPSEMGRLPDVIPDSAVLPDPRTDAVPLRSGSRSHVGVPLRLPNGRLFGSFCCFRDKADASPNDRDLRLMQIFGDLIAKQIVAENQQRRVRNAKVRRIRQALRKGEPVPVYQPVFRLSDGLLLGAEALARFAGPPARPPDRWFDEAGEVGLQTALELQAIRNAVAACAPALRLRSDLRLAINAAPDTLLSPDFATLIRDLPVERIALEITEHEPVEDYRRLTKALAPLRRRGCKIAVDDAGSGYASLRHILQIEPDVIKLDVSLTSGIDASAGKRALAGSLIEFSRQTGSVIIAEGVETPGELAALRELRVNSAQGYLLARPAPIEDLCARLEAGGHADAPIGPA